MYWLSYSSLTSHHPSQTPCLPWISYATQKLMLNSCKMVEKQCEAFHRFLWHFFPSLKQNFISYRSPKVSDCILEIHQLWQSGFCRVYFNCCCSCSLEAEIISIGQSSHKMYSNNIVNFKESTRISNACTKTVLSYAPRTSSLANLNKTKKICWVLIWNQERTHSNIIQMFSAYDFKNFKQEYGFE